MFWWRRRRPKLRCPGCDSRIGQHTRRCWRCGLDIRRARTAPAEVEYFNRDARLKKLGYSDYDDYLRSDLWETRRESFKKGLADTRCAICSGRRNLVVHHLTYERLGSEADRDLLLLCEWCHHAFHRWARWKGATANAQFLQRFASERQEFLAERKSARVRERQRAREARKAEARARSRPFAPRLSRDDRGWVVIDAHTGEAYDDEDLHLICNDVFLFRVAGLWSHYRQPSQHGALVPGNPVSLVRQPNNRVDPYAVAIRNPATDEQVGWVPRTLSKKVAGLLDRGVVLNAVCVGEDHTGKERSGIRLLLGARVPAGPLER